MIARRRPVPDVAAIQAAIDAARESLNEFKSRVASVKRAIRASARIGVDPTSCRVTLRGLIEQKDAAQRDLALQQKRINALGERRLDRVIARLLTVDRAESRSAIAQPEDCR